MSPGQWWAAALVLAVTVAILLLGIEIGRRLGPRPGEESRVARLADPAPIPGELPVPLPGLPVAGRFTFGGAADPAVFELPGSRLARHWEWAGDQHPVGTNPLPAIDADYARRERWAADQVAILEAEIRAEREAGHVIVQRWCPGCDMLTADGRCGYCGKGTCSRCGGPCFCTQDDDL